MQHFIAFDLGATSGRTVLGTLTEGELRIRELTRFPNQVLPLDGHFYWNIFSLYEHLCEGLKTAAREGVEITSIGIDTWGVDFAFVGKDGSLLGLPYAYRDPHTEGIPAEYFDKIMSREEVYARTGIQIMPFNTLFQLYAMHKNGSSQLAAAKKLLFMPDALSYLMTGNMVTEYTIASTSQLLNPRTHRIETDLFTEMGINPALFCDIVMPGKRIGVLEKRLADRVGLKQIPVVAVAGHDTASAVAAVPAENERFAYLSSGTWSLMGIEVREPVINERTLACNITNEGGVDGTTRLLKNITGMWLLEECLKCWKREGYEYTYPELVKMAQEATPFKAMINPDDEAFAHPDCMPEEIAKFCERSGQEAPRNHGETVRAIFESLALKYRKVLDIFRTLAPFPIEKLHVIGGGSKNELLNRFTADSTGIPVVAGPSEATAIGNIMMQAYAAGRVSSLSEMRRMIARCVPTKTYMPEESAAWQSAYERFETILAETSTETDK